MPLALLLAVAAVYPFARPSLRAAFVVGVTSLVGSVLAILDARWNGFAAGQLTAFALVAAAASLRCRRSCSPTTSSWRSGRLSGSRASRAAVASFGVSHEDVSFHAADGVSLADERGRGRSGGRSDAFGWDWPGDVDSAVSFLERHGVRHVGVLGLSTGAEVALTSAAEDHRIAAVVADGTEARTMDDFEHQKGLDKWSSLPHWGVATTAVHLIRDTPSAPPLDDVVGKIAPRPLLLIESNNPAERALAPVWARVDRRPGVLWHVDAAHTKGLASHPAAYRDRVLGLFDRALLQ